MAISNLRQKSIFDQFNIPDLSGGTLGYGLDMNTSFMPDAKSPTYEDENTFRSSNLAGDMRTPEDIQGIGSASNISKVSDVSTRPPQKSVQDELKEYIDAVNSGYTPDTSRSNALNKLLDETPDINNYNPSFARKLVAGLQSIKDPTQGQKTLNQPYLQDMAQWTAKTAPFQAAATSENARNTNERTLVGNAAAAMTTANRADRQAQTAQDRITSQEKIATEKAEIARTRNNINAARNAQLEIVARGDSVYGYDRNPNGKAPVYLGPSGGLDAADFLNARADANIRQAQATGGEVYFDSNGKPVIIQRNAPSGGAQPGTAQSGSGTSEGPLYKPGTAPKPNALETARERDAKLQSIFENNNPEETQFLKRDRNTGKVTFLPRPVVGATKPGTTTLGFGGTPYTKDDLTRWDQLKAELEPGYVPPPSVSPAATQGLGPRQPPPVQQQQQVPVQQSPVQQQQPPKPYNPTSPFQIQESAPPSSPDWWNNLNKPTGNPAVLENQNAITRLTRVLNDPNVPNEMKDSIFNQIQALTLKQELLENPQAVQQMNQPQQSDLQPGEVKIRDKQTGKVFAIPAANLKNAPPDRYEQVR